VISPKAHAAIDYPAAATFLTMSGLLWRKNQRAALASLICGGTELLVSLLTDYPGGACPGPSAFPCMAGSTRG